MGIIPNGVATKVLPAKQASSENTFRAISISGTVLSLSYSLYLDCLLLTVDKSIKSLDSLSLISLESELLQKLPSGLSDGIESGCAIPAPTKSLGSKTLETGSFAKAKSNVLKKSAQIGVAICKNLYYYILSSIRYLNMRYFFVLTHLGVDLQKWNDLLKSNIYLKSAFDINNPKHYVNSSNTILQTYDEKRNTRIFDILAFNWQTGHKDTLDFSKVIYVQNDSADAILRIRNSGKIHRKYVDDYYELRINKIKQILKTNKDHIILRDQDDEWYKNKNRIADFLEVPPLFIQGGTRR